MFTLYLVSISSEIINYKNNRNESMSMVNYRESSSISYSVVDTVVSRNCHSHSHFASPWTHLLVYNLCGSYLLYPVIVIILNVNV